jgi:4-diphosphocytidyl-2-C-methyl-D-erythritol kinase
LVVFPNCKINLGLHILRKREDGYHDIETVFYPLPFHDALEVIENENELFSTTGLPVGINPNDNLCLKAYTLLKNDFASIPQVQMHLHKGIPAGAGLGGGSADAAFTIKLLNNKFDLQLSIDQMMHYALRLGSDCPFFIINKPCFATGRGEILQEVNLDLSNYKIIIVNPAIHIKTANAFSEIRPKVPPVSLKEIIQKPVNNWKQELKNDFEEIIFKRYPAIDAIKTNLYEAGAIYCAMSGSGSTVYGLFEKDLVPKLSFPDYFVKELHS